jgi:ribosomal protein S19
MRSKYKLPYIHPFLWSKCLNKNSFISSFKTTNRRIFLHPILFNTNFHVHSGKAYYDLHLNSFMVNHKFGEFVFTRKKCIFRNKKNKKKLFRKKK